MAHPASLYPASIDRTPLNDADLLQIISLEFAYDTTTEAPWYGFYNLVLGGLGGIIVREKQKSALVIFPQFALTTDAIAYDSDEEDHDDVDDDDYMPESPTPAGSRNDQASRAETDELSGIPPNTDIRPRPQRNFVRITASPDELNITANPRADNDIVTQTQSPSSGSGGSPAVSPPAHPIREMSVKERELFLSTRIPDFLRRRFYLNARNIVTANRVDLIVELKKKQPYPSQSFQLTLDGATSQASEQARHAFAQDDKLMILSYIVGIGNSWAYGEFQRADILGGTFQPPVRASRDDSSEASSTPGSTPSPISTDKFASNSASKRAHFPASGGSSTSALLSGAAASRSDAHNPFIVGRMAPVTPQVPRLNLPRFAGLSPTNVEALLNHNTFPRTFSNITGAAQKRWFQDIRERLEELDDFHRNSYI